MKAVVRGADQRNARNQLNLSSMGLGIEKESLHFDS